MKQSSHLLGELLRHTDGGTQNLLFYECGVYGVTWMMMMMAVMFVIMLMAMVVVRITMYGVMMYGI